MTKHWDLKKKRNGFNILSDWTTEKMRRFYPFCRVAHQNEPPEIDTTKDHCGTKAESMMIGATTIWFYSNYVASNNIRWMENSKDSNETAWSQQPQKVIGIESRLVYSLYVVTRCQRAKDESWFTATTHWIQNNLKATTHNLEETMAFNPQGQYGLWGKSRKFSNFPWTKFGNFLRVPWHCGKETGWLSGKNREFFQKIGILTNKNWARKVIQLI